MNVCIKTYLFAGDWPDMYPLNNILLQPIIFTVLTIILWHSDVSLQTRSRGNKCLIYDLVSKPSAYFWFLLRLQCTHCHAYAIIIISSTINNDRHCLSMLISPTKFAACWFCAPIVHGSHLAWNLTCFHPILVLLLILFWCMLRKQFGQVTALIHTCIRNSFWVSYYMWTSLTRKNMKSDHIVCCILTTYIDHTSLSYSNSELINIHTVFLRKM